MREFEDNFLLQIFPVLIVDYLEIQKHNFFKSSKAQKLDNMPGINACIKEEVSIEIKINRTE